jgi:hypothetical protein
MDNSTFAALRIQLDQVVKDLEYLASEGVSVPLSKEELGIMAGRAATIRSLVAEVERSERRASQRAGGC